MKTVASVALSALLVGCGSSSSTGPGQSHSSSGGGGSHSSSGAGSADAGLCKDPPPALLAFNTCAATKCPSQYSDSNAACPVSLNPCYAACECSDIPCITKCYAMSPASCMAAEAALSKCTTAMGCAPMVPFPTNSIAFVGELPAGVPTACMGATYFEIASVKSLCAGAPAYFLCDGTTYTAYNCTMPSSPWMPAG